VTDLNVFAEFKPRLPERYRDSKFVFLANIAPDLQGDVLHQVKGTPKLVAMDTMNYWIERTNAELRETLKHVDILMINDSETRQLSSEHNLLRAAKHIFKMGPSALVVKRGEYGAMLVDKNGVFCIPAFPLEEPHDPTGAGDKLCRRLHGLSCGCWQHDGRFAPPRYGLWLRARQLYRGTLWPGTSAETQKAGDTRQGTPLFEIDPIQTLSGRISLNPGFSIRRCSRFNKFC